MATPTPPTPHRKSMVGSKTNFWLHSSTHGFDISHPSTPSTASPTPLLKISTTTSPVTLSAAKTALIIIDMQNFFLSPSLGHSPSSPGHLACSALLASAIPAARRAGIRIVWVNWGLTADEVEEMPAGVKRAFGFYSIDGGAEHDVRSVVTGGVVEGSVGVDRHGKESGGKRSAYRGIGADMGDVEVAGGGKVEAGRLLMRDTWNADLYPPLREAFEVGRRVKEKPDVWVHKNRMSALWGPETELEVFLKKEGITSLLFAGVNTDQCVGGTLTDAFSKGYDCILLSDGCGTSSPGYAQECWEFNAAHTFGFCASCKDFADGVDKMGK